MPNIMPAVGTVTPKIKHNKIGVVPATQGSTKNYLSMDDSNEYIPMKNNSQIISEQQQLGMEATGNMSQILTLDKIAEM